MKIKREYPAFHAGASRYLAVPLSTAILILIVAKYFSVKNAKDLYPFCITAFGISIAMAQLAFRFIPQIRKDQMSQQSLYAGEKFSLCAVLVLQLLMIAFCKETLSPYFEDQKLRFVAYGGYALLSSLWVLIGISAVWSWHFAYCAFHDELWLNWKERIEEINAKKTE